MTKDELEKEAIKYDAEHLRMGRTRWYHNVTVREAYLAGAEPREKRIAELEKACDETEELLDKQIEATYKVVEKLTKAKEIISKFLNAKSIEETCVAESEAEKLIKEVK